MTPTEIAVAETMSRHGFKLPMEQIAPETAMSQDALIDGIDVDDFVWDLEAQFGSVVWSVPWGRFSDQTTSFRGCGCALLPFWTIWRVFWWPFEGRLIPLPKEAEERLTVRHLAKVLDEGAWCEPEEVLP
ncbi:hypothetical protein IC614_04195 [Allosphingosinicella flava]|uniref:Uncharacterized protein n=1 Tax=Allosphingosinicella flava TaxID=2771430 RepID=A0A7T2LMQ1_9SPHN|nr:hypothetical protein [Sphingosinicella flava]QPQ55796.1 hypothetical protein IC614_04195 [Sphingosinicella flava]